MAESDLLSEFENFGFSVAKTVLSKCDELLSRYGLAADEFVESWLAFSAMKYNGDSPSLETLSQFETEVLARKKSASGLVPSSRLKDLDDSLVIHDSTSIRHLAEDDDLLGAYGTPAAKLKKRGVQAPQGTPQNKRLAGVGQSSIPLSPSIASSPTTPGASWQKFSARNNAGQVVVRFPQDCDPVDWSRSGALSATIGAYSKEDCLQGQGFKYMFSRIKDRHYVLDDQIHELGDVIRHNQKDLHDWNANNEVASEKLNIVGRICCDVSGGARLNATSLLLEGSDETCSALSVPLDVGRVADYSLFPGQIVAARATNPTGRRIVVDNIFTPAIQATPQNEEPIIDESTGPLNLVVACGPFSPMDDFDLCGLDEVLDGVNKLKPHVVVLMGPFIDAKNKKVEQADLSRTFEDEFEATLDRIERTVDSCVQVVLVPSWRDVHHQTVYPTCPFRTKKSRPNLHMFADPCIINISGVYVALTSTDILMHLGKEEIALMPQGSDRLGRLASHLLSQQSFYPLYPPAEEMSCDLEHWQRYCRLPFAPHLLILPSDLRHFVKNVSGCVVVNPERVVKGTSAGTYARLQVKAAKKGLSVAAEIVRV